MLVQRMWMLVLMLLWYVSRTKAEGSSTANSPCATRLAQQSNCSVSLFTSDVVGCCNAISKEIKNDQACMCDIFQADVYTATYALAECVISFDIVTVCYLDSTTTTTPSFSTPPADLTSSYTSAAIALLVAPLVTTVGIIIVIVISIYCICKGRKPGNTATYSQAYAEMPKYPTTTTGGSNPSAFVKPTSTPMTNVPQSMSTSTAPSSKTDFVTDKSMQFDLSTLRAATNNFSEDNKMGEGAFGCVYKGILPDGRKIAVKKLLNVKKNVDQEIKAEIELLTTLQHQNLVRLQGFCLKKPEAILVYEFLPNGSLDFFIYDDEKRRELNWSIRFEIVRGIAKGLLYLHEDSHLKTIHRDLKPPNILLDANMKAKIADFGLARICSPDQTHVQSMHKAGTPGYMSPENLHGQFSPKSDVYAFGVLVLEIISGRRISYGSENQLGEPSNNLMSYAWRCWADEKPLTFVDPLMTKDSLSNDEVIKCIHLCLLCTQDNPQKRPNMSTIVHKLNSNPDIATLATPQYPNFLIFNSPTGQSTKSSMHGHSSGAASSSVYSNSKLSH